jgi:hypothetical protein
MGSAMISIITVTNKTIGKLKKQRPKPKVSHAQTKPRRILISIKKYIINVKKVILEGKSGARVATNIVIAIDNTVPKPMSNHV